MLEQAGRTGWHDARASLNSPARQRFALRKADAIRLEYVVLVDVVGMDVVGPCPLVLSLVILLLGHDVTSYDGGSYRRTRTTRGTDPRENRVPVTARSCEPATGLQSAYYEPGPLTTTTTF